MHVAPRQIWRPLRSFLILTCAGGVVLAADNTWRNEVRLDFATTDWWSSISSVEMQTADIAVASEPANRRAPQLSMGRFLNGVLFSKPLTSWRLASETAPETTNYTSAWMTQQSGGTFVGSTQSELSRLSFSASEFVGSGGPSSPSAVTATGSWTSGVSGNWGTSANWSGGIIADGAGNDAHFDTLNISNAVTVTLDTSRTIGNLFIGDTDGTHSYTISPSAGATLTFDDNSSNFFDSSTLRQSSTSGGDTIAVPILTANDLNVNNLSTTNTLTISGSIGGTGGHTNFPIVWFNNVDTSIIPVGDIHVSGNIGDGASGLELNVVVNGGTITFSGTNTYKGFTQVSGGTLLVNGDNSAANGGVSVYNSGTLGGTGTIGGNVNISGGTITGATSTTVGTLTLLGNADFSDRETGGGTYLANLSGATSDLLAITGSLTLGADTTLSIIGSGNGTTTYILATFASRVNDTMFQFIGGDGIPAGYSLVYNPTDIELVPTAIPEPATWIGGALALGAIGFASRRRLRSA